VKAFEFLDHAGVPRLVALQWENHWERRWECGEPVNLWLRKFESPVVSNRFLPSMNLGVDLAMSLVSRRVQQVREWAGADILFNGGGAVRPVVRYSPDGVERFGCLNAAAARYGVSYRELKRSIAIGRDGWYDVLGAQEAYSKREEFATV